MRRVTPIFHQRMNRDLVGLAPTGPTVTFEIVRQPERVQRDPGEALASYYAAFKAGGGQTVATVEATQSDDVKRALKHSRGVRELDGVPYLDGCARCYRLTDELARKIDAGEAQPTDTVSCSDCLSEWRIRDDVRPVR